MEKINYKRLIGAILLTIVVASGIAINIKNVHDISWEQVLTLRFWILTIIHIIPAYFVVWSFEDNYESWWESRVILNIIVVLWAIVFGIICLISHFVFGFDLL